jgi:hypothetical protein
MHKRHGEAVTMVLKRKVAENAANLVDGSLDDTSLLALVIGQKYQSRSRPDRLNQPVDSQYLTTGGIEQILRGLEAKVDALAGRKSTTKHRARLPRRRDAVIFAALVMNLKGMKYCLFLKDHGVKPRWSDPAPSTYPSGYQAGQPWRKKIQDEKTRARQRMEEYTNSQLAEAFTAYLANEFQQLSAWLYSRNSRNASKYLAKAQPAWSLQNLPVSTRTIRNGGLFARSFQPTIAQINDYVFSRFRQPLNTCKSLKNKSLKRGVANMLSDNVGFEVIDAIELARRWSVPVSWIREQTRGRAVEPLPCVRLGRYVRFEWGSPGLLEWWQKRRA